MLRRPVGPGSFGGHGEGVLWKMWSTGRISESAAVLAVDAQDGSR